MCTSISSNSMRTTCTSSVRTGSAYRQLLRRRLMLRVLGNRGACCRTSNYSVHPMF